MQVNLSPNLSSAHTYGNRFMYEQVASSTAATLSVDHMCSSSGDSGAVQLTEFSRAGTGNRWEY